MENIRKSDNSVESVKLDTTIDKMWHNFEAQQIQKAGKYNVLGKPSLI